MKCPNCRRKMKHLEYPTPAGPRQIWICNAVELKGKRLVRVGCGYKREAKGE